MTACRSHSDTMPAVIVLSELRVHHATTPAIIAAGILGFIISMPAAGATTIGTISAINIAGGT